MNDAALKKALAEFGRLGNALDAEAKRRYGPNAFLFHEADGSVVLMAGDARNDIAPRPKGRSTSANRRQGSRDGDVARCDTQPCG